MTFSEIGTDRLILAELKSSDEGAIDLFSNESVVEYYDLDAFTSADQARDLIAQRESIF
jgi:ribosomal-protein-alanine N-acetyltransferase